MTNFLNSSIPDIRKIKNLGIKDTMRMVVTFLNSLIPDIRKIKNLGIKDAMRMVVTFLNSLILDHNKSRTNDAVRLLCRHSSIL